jgi:hypothetical protein
VTVEMFQPEIEEALKVYDRHVVCLEKTPDECRSSLHSLMEKAIQAFEGRGPNLRHGIAVDKQLTIILSQSDHERPLCAIYFNLHTPYFRQPERKTVSGSSSRG